MSSAEPNPEPTTPLQWAVRWHAVVLAALLFAWLGDAWIAAGLGAAIYAVFTGGALLLLAGLASLRVDDVDPDG